MAHDPFRPLDAAEITTTVDVIRKQRALPDTARFSHVVLDEPPKGHEGEAPRRAFAVLLDRASGVLSEAVVDLSQGSLASWRDVPGALPALLMEEAFVAIIAVKEDARWQAAMRARGIDDFDTVQLDPWPPGRFDEPWYDGDRRLARVLSYVRTDPADNGYARPVEGVTCIVDVGAGEVLEVIDTGVVPLPPQGGSYYPDAVGPLRTDRKPLEIHQAEGASFTLDGHHLRWQRWDLSVSMHPIQGLVLHRVGYDDAGRRRPILHRAALAEMVVPYGDPDPNHRWKNAFDCGEWGLGRLVNSLTLGCDCLGEVHYLDSVQCDENGNPYTVDNAICIHEEDYGILWKHHDLHSGTTEVRRRRRLVVSSIHTVGNYEYAFYWYFYEDGTLQLEVKLTGIVQTKAVADGGSPHAPLIAPGLAAPHHQHLFCVRLDAEVDGTANTVVEVDVERDPVGPANEWGNAFSPRETVLDRESVAQRVVDASRSRTWRIENRSSRNAVGQPVAYKLVPGSTPTLLADPTSVIAGRASFATRNLWVTAYDPAQMRASGDYPSQHPGGDGLPAFGAGDRDLVDADVVLWYTFGVTHVVRPEDWPVMPTEHTGFLLLPFGFFDRNPALDVAPSEAHCHT